MLKNSIFFTVTYILNNKSLEVLYNMRKKKATQKEIHNDLFGAMVGWLQAQHPHRFIPYDLTLPECEQIDILLNNDLVYRINFINKYNPKRRYKYLVYRKLNGEMIVYKIFND